MQVLRYSNATSCGLDDVTFSRPAQAGIRHALVN